MKLGKLGLSPGDFAQGFAKPASDDLPSRAEDLNIENVTASPDAPKP